VTRCLAVSLLRWRKDAFLAGALALGALYFGTCADVDLA